MRIIAGVFFSVFLALSNAAYADEIAPDDAVVSVALKCIAVRIVNAAACQGSKG